MMRIGLRAVLAAFVVAGMIGVGCEKKSGTPTPQDPGSTTPPTGGPTPPPVAAAKAWPTDAAATGTISGTIKVGSAPAMPAIDMASKPDCVALHGDTKPTAELVVAGANGGLRDVFVYLDDASVAAQYTPPAPPAEPAVLDQKGCIYVPHVIGIQVKQDLKVLNSDPFLHNVNAPPLNLAMGGKDEAGKVKLLKKHFKKPAVPATFKCDVHPWMSAYACVVTHPCYAVTDADGNFKITGVPPGKYKLKFWHEPAPGLTAPADQDVEVKAGEDTAIEATF